MSGGNKVTKFIRNNMMLTILVVICIVIAFTAPGFFTVPNILGIFRNNAFKGVIAFGMTMVIICGEIDLSIGSTVALSGIITARVAGGLNAAGMPLEVTVIFGMIVALVVSALIGLFIGVIRTKFNIPTFIITLALLSGGFPVLTLPQWYNRIGAGSVLGIPIPAIILVIVFIVINIIMSYTAFGRSVYAAGGNPEAARLSGVNVTKVKILVMIAVQLMAALGGIMNSSQVMSAAHNFGRGWEMDVIASVIIGGTSMNGGIGKVKGTFLGIIFLGVLLNGMTLLNLNEYIQYVVRGGLILIAVMINTIQLNRQHKA